MKDKQDLIESIERRLKSDYQVTLKEAAVAQLHDAWQRGHVGYRRGLVCEPPRARLRARAYYFSAEYMMGRMVYTTFCRWARWRPYARRLPPKGWILPHLRISRMRPGQRRLGQACGLLPRFRRHARAAARRLRHPLQIRPVPPELRDGFQAESADDWQRLGDPWSLRRDTHAVNVCFAGRPCARYLRHAHTGL